MRIVLCYPAVPRHIEQIAAVAPAAEIVDAGQEHIARELASADIFCGHPKVPVPWDDAVHAGRLKWIQSTAAGLDHCLVPSVVQSEIVVCSASGVMSDAVAEQALALLLGLLRGLPEYSRARHVREFIRRPTGDLHGARVGIVGLGGNGRRLAEILAAFGCEILATDWFPVNKPPHVAELLPADALDEMLPRVKILILTPPLNRHTRGMIDARRLALLPRGAWLINVARGPLVVEEALADALGSRHLSGAGIDVTVTEPLPAESRLWGIPNLLLSPHVGGQSAVRNDRMTKLFCENLRRYLDGRPLLNLVDKELGFPVPGSLAGAV